MPGNYQNDITRKLKSSGKYSWTKWAYNIKKTENTVLCAPVQPKVEPKKYAKGLVVGNFFPLTNDHINLLTKAVSECDDIIIVCTRMSDPYYDEKILVEWLKHYSSHLIILKKKVNDQIVQLCPVNQAQAFINLLSGNELNDLEVVYGFEPCSNQLTVAEHICPIISMLNGLCYAELLPRNIKFKLQGLLGNENALNLEIIRNPSKFKDILPDYSYSYLTNFHNLTIKDKSWIQTAHHRQK